MTNDEKDSFVIRHSSFVIRHSSFVIRHSSFVISYLTIANKRVTTSDTHGGNGTPVACNA